MKTLYLYLFILVSASSFGQTFEWAVKAGSVDNEKSQAITIDDDGNIYHVGQFRGSCDFDPGPAVFNLTVGGSLPSVPDGYLCKLNNNGNLIWAKQLSGTSDDMIFDIVLDHNNNLFLSGNFSDSVDVDLGAGINIIADGGGFVAKYDTAGNLIWLNRVDFYIPEIKIDVNNNIIVSAKFTGTVDFDPGPGVFNLSGYQDNVVVKFSSAGNFIWAKGLIHTQPSTTPASELLTVNNSIYICGPFIGTLDMDPGPGVYNLTAVYYDSYVAKYDAAGNFIWAFSLSSSGHDRLHTICADAAGNILVAGYYADTMDVDPGPGIYQLVPPNAASMFILKVDTTSNFLWAKSFGVTTTESMAATLDLDDEIYITADFSSTGDFDPGPGIVNLTSAGAADVFLLKLNSTGDFQWVRKMGGISHDRVYDIALDSLNNIYSCGVFNGTVDFNPPNMVNLISSGMFDIFVTKFSETPLGINEVSVTNSPRIFPNPTSGKFHIILSDNEKLESVHITDIMGRSVPAKVVSENSGYEINFDARPGIYCTHIFTDHGNYVTILVRE